MADNLTYMQLERKNKQLEREVQEYIRKEKEYENRQKLFEYSHFRRTMNLMKINEELCREINQLKSADKEKMDEELEQVSNTLRERIKELSCLYNISNLRASTNFSLDDVLQAIVDFIPQAFLYSDIICARIIFDRYEYKTSNFISTKWKLSQEIKLNNERIGSLEVCYLEEKYDFEKGPFLKEAKNLIISIAENIAQIVEREWVEMELRKCRDKIEELIELD